MNYIIYPPKTPVAFIFLNLKIYWYGIIMALSFFIGIFLCSWLLSKKYSKKVSGLFLDLVPGVILIGIIGARVFYILGNLDFYLKMPIEIFMLNHGGLSIYGALVFGILYFIYYARKNKIEMLKYFDAAFCVIPLCQAIGRFGNYFNQEAYGAPYNGPFKLFVDISYRKDSFLNIKYYHPTFLYESILDFILFLVLFLCFLKIKNLKQGTIFYLYLISYPIIRIMVESLRIDSTLNIASIPIATILSFIFLLFGIVFLIRQNKKEEEGGI